MGKRIATEEKQTELIQEIHNLNQEILSVSEYKNAAQAAATTATTKASEASTSAAAAAASASDADTAATALTTWLADKETLTAPAVDPTLSISGAAADAQITGFFNDVLNTAVDKGYADNEEYSPLVTASGLADCTSTLTGNSSGYSNGWSAYRDCYMTGLKVVSGTTSTKVSIFIVNDDNTLDRSYTDVSISIVNDEITLPFAIKVKKGQTPCIRLLGGKYYYYVAGSAIYKEWIQGTGYVASTIRAGYDIIYQNIFPKFNDSLNIALSGVLSAVNNGYAEATYSNTEKKSYTDIVLANTNSGGRDAWWNNFSFPIQSLLTGIQLTASCPTTEFGIYVFDESFNLVSYIASITPTIVNDAFDLTEPLVVPKNGKVFLLYINGTYKAYNTGSATNKKYNPSTQTMVSTEVYQGSFDVKYKEIVSVNFVNYPAKIKLDDFPMPKTVNGNGNYTLVGRWFTLNSKETANTDGASIIFKVKGATYVDVNLLPITTPNYTPYFAYSLDGATFTRQKITSPRITIPTTDEHLLWVVVDGMGESDPTLGKWNGTVGIQIESITTDGTLTAQTPQNKKIYCIGDSMVEGINVLGSGSNADVNSATTGFAWKMCRKLNAIPLMCGYGGSGLTSGGSFNTANNAVQYNKNVVPINDMQPDVVFIEHGYNDGTASDADFTTAYQQLIDTLKVMYNGVPILCMIPFKQTHATQIRYVASQNSMCYVIETSDFTVTTSDNTHPDVSGANTASTALAAKIETLLSKGFFL